ncbi:MAG: hypothetical protein JO295_12790 [Verrucomicrobia bacterium]|nr:hypothetical protein [Verrucomicrobiota bacterium]
MPSFTASTIRSTRHGASLRASLPGVGLLLLLAGGAAHQAGAQSFTPGDLLVSRTVYQGMAATVTVGQALPNGAQAVADGSYPNVFRNETPDPSFGVTAPLFLDQLDPTTGARASITAVPTSVLVTSFPSKSEGALNLSADGTAITFMGYRASVNALDISNSNTPGVPDPGNPVASVTPTYRVIAQMNANGAFTSTTTNAYPGNNGRAAILASNGNYYTVGNAGNGGSGPSTQPNVTGVQLVTPGVNAPSNTAGTTSVGTYNVTQNGYTADKPAKDNNFRGETIYNNTLYVTKGSGSNGINTVYQVGTAGTLPTGTNNTISILPGFPTTLANTAGAMHPFGLFFASPTVLYVADEGDGVAANATTSGGGLQKWTFNLATSAWSLAYTLTNGLNLGVQYAVANGPNGEVYPTNLNPATDGLRNLAGRLNANGTVTLYAITSTVSANTDQGADPNKLVAITDNLLFTTAQQASQEQFNTLESAAYGEALRGVSLTPTVPEPSTWAMAIGGVGVLLVLRPRIRRSMGS